jgi:hypothetical protein
MAYSMTHDYSETVCPVPEHVLSAIHRASPHEALNISKLLPGTQRARFALFCYARTHLREAGLAIAIGCTDEDLVREGGIAGQALIAQRALPKADRSRSRAPVSLATPSNQHLFLTQDDEDNDEDEDEDDAESEAAA